MNYSRFLKYAKWGLENEIEKLKEEIENNKKHPENSEYSAINGLYYRLIQEYERDLNFINRKVNDETTFVDIY